MIEQHDFEFRPEMLLPSVVNRRFQEDTAEKDPIDHNDIIDIKIWLFTKLDNINPVNV